MILCIGTTPTMQRTMVFERLKIDDVNRAVMVHEHASGKGVNVARVLTLLGKPALALGFAGGRRGQALLEDITAAGIAHDFIAIPAETRLCTTIIDRATMQVTELVEEAPPAQPMEWAELVDRIDKKIASASIVIFSGTLAPGAPDDFCDSWIGKVPLVIVDAKGEPMRRALAAKGRVIAKLNREEFSATVRATLDTDADLSDAMRRHCPKEGWLIVTMGKAGALACIEGNMLRLIAPQIDAVSPIGSGDAFAAGLAAAVDGSPQDALKLACACGVANALTPFSGYLQVEDVQRLLEQVRIEPA